MSDVYIAYKPEDRAKVQGLAAALTATGRSVWWDRDVVVGEGWRARMERELEEAGCVIVAWTKLSVSADAEFVHDEAQRAAERGVLLPVLLESVKPPLGFGGRPGIDLSGWSGDVADLRFIALRAAVSAIVGAGPKSLATVRAIPMKTVAFTATTVALLSSMLGFAGNVASVQVSACRMPLVRAGVCRTFGLGGVPTQAEDEVWYAAKSRRDGEGLRGYLRRYPTGSYTAEAQTRLAGCRPDARETWIPDTRVQPLIISAVGARYADDGAARTAALVRGREESAFVCSGYAQGEFRLTGAEAKAQTWHCSSHGGGRACGFDGQAVCKVAVRHVDNQEICRDERTGGALAGAGSPAKP